MNKYSYERSDKMNNCMCNTIHKDLVEDINKKLCEEDKLIDMADFFKIFGDSTRLKIINVLLHSRMCVCDIASCIDMSHSAVSHQLRVLKQFKMVKYKKEGKTVYYELDDDHISKIFKEGFNHVSE